MDKIIGLGNALVDVLATLEDDMLLDEMGLPKGSMQLIDDAKLQQINAKFSQMKNASCNRWIGRKCHTWTRLSGCRNRLYRKSGK